MRLILEGDVVRVIDGDTVEVEVRRRLVVRLLDCWSPELRKGTPKERKSGRLAKERLRALLESEEVEIDIPIDAAGRFGDAMSFGRILGHVRRKRDGANVAEILVQEGHATPTKPRERKS